PCASAPDRSARVGHDRSARSLRSTPPGRGKGRGRSAARLSGPAWQAGRLSVMMFRLMRVLCLPASAPRASRRLAAATVLASVAPRSVAPRAVAPPTPAAAPAPAPAPAPFGETVFSRLDLLGWRKLGILSLQTPPLDVGGADAMLDNDARTLVSAPGVSNGEF